MKEITKTLLPLLLLVLVTATSCGKDEPDGTSDKMQWKAPTDLVQVLEGVYQVPLSGGSFTFICENCEPMVESLYERGPHVSYEIPGPSHYIEGVWSSVQCKKKKINYSYLDFKKIYEYDDLFEIRLQSKEVLLCLKEGFENDQEKMIDFFIKNVSSNKKLVIIDKRKRA